MRSSYTSVFGRPQYGVLGRDYVGGGNTGISDLYDTALFFQDRMEFSPQFSILFGARIDALQDHTRDPLNCAPGGAGDYTCLADTTNILASICRRATRRGSTVLETRISAPCTSSHPRSAAI